MARKKVPVDSLFEFFELAPFVRRWEAWGFPDEELGNLQIEIMADPRRHPVIQGTKGLRKMRYSPVSWSRGKSGALRVCYVYFERFETIILVIAYAKNEMDDIPERMKPAFNQAIDQMEMGLETISKGKTRDKGKH